MPNWLKKMTIVAHEVLLVREDICKDFVANLGQWVAWLCALLVLNETIRYRSAVHRMSF
jgi:hypothetical protein